MPIGLLAIAAAQAAGATEIAAIDVFPGPQERAAALGATCTTDVSREALPENAFDVVLECSGVSVSVSAAITAARPTGTIVQIGMAPDETRPVNLAPFIAKELRFLGTFRFRDEIDDAISLLAARPQIESVITHEFSADQVPAAFAAAKGSQSSGRSSWPSGRDTRKGVARPLLTADTRSAPAPGRRPASDRVRPQARG